MAETHDEQREEPVRCTQCDRLAVVSFQGSGPLCVEHDHMFAMSNYARAAQLNALQNQISASMQRTFGTYTPPVEMPPFPSRGVDIDYSPTTIQGSTVGAVNTGAIAGQAQVSVTLLRGQGASDLADAITELGNAIQASREITEEIRADLLGHIAFLADQANRPEEQRYRGLIKTALGALRNGVTAAAGLTTIWDKVGPIIEQAPQLT